MRENLFKMGANLGDGWSSDNKSSHQKEQTVSKIPKEHKLHFAREKRNGKVVTISKPFYLSDTDAKDLLKNLKKLLATGGAIRGDTIEFQGEVKDKLKLALIELGYGMK